MSRNAVNSRITGEGIDAMPNEPLVCRYTEGDFE
jgi:hypothetical protein